MFNPTDYNCHHCGNPFSEVHEEIFVITNLIIEGSYIDNKLHWRWLSNKDKHDPVNLYFHRSCFKEVAGKLYMGTP